MRLVRTAVLRGCWRAPHPRHGQRLRVDLIAHSKLADRPGPAGHRRGRRVVCKGSGDCAPLEVNNPHPHQSWNYPPAVREINESFAKSLNQKRLKRCANRVHFYNEFFKNAPVETR